MNALTDLMAQVVGVVCGIVMLTSLLILFAVSLRSAVRIFRSES